MADTTINAEELERDINKALKNKIPALISQQYAYVGILLGARAWRGKHGFPYNPNWVNGDLIPVHPKPGVTY